jgi:hypothetical protein
VFVENVSNRLKRALLKLQPPLNGDADAAAVCCWVMQGLYTYPDVRTNVPSYSNFGLETARLTGTQAPSLRVSMLRLIYREAILAEKIFAKAMDGFEGYHPRDLEKW